ncbi:MAG: NADH-quinone oxidoreductase subunit D [Candidatus Azobacteroides sp.]|nr:NADH-quinone oxidoreductase subunit D [Candidatus Azobacteroides sp.]
MLRKKEGYDFLLSLTGIDLGEALGVIYHLSKSENPMDLIVLKTSTTDRENPQLFSVTDIWRTANLNEREVFGLFGIRFINHPDMRRLFLNNSWNGFPFRKDYDENPELNPLNLESECQSDKLRSLSFTKQGVIEREGEVFSKEEYVVNIGPQHPATHGVLHFRVSLDGEIIKKVDPHLGYIHRGVEKMCERMSYPQMLHLTDRLDYLSAHINRHALCMCIEKAAEIEVSERVLYIRTIMDELTRIASHLLGWASMCMDMGALTAFIYGMRDREKIIDIFEATCGARLIMNYNVIGGVMYDLHPDFQKQVKEFIPYMRKMMKEYHQIFTGNIIASERMHNIGMLTKKKAIAYGVTGPSGRASGFSCDVRKHKPYGVYDKVNFSEMLREEGDAFARYMLRLDEIMESLNILEQLIDNIPEGSIQTKIKPIIRIPEGEYFQAVEAARGLFGVYICSKGDKSPYRLKFRSPGLPLISIVNLIAREEKIADLIAIGGSLDYVVPDIDR